VNDQLIQFGHWYLLLDRIRRLWITIFKHPCFAEERYVNKSNSISQTEYATDTGSQRCPIWARLVVGELWCVPGTVRAARDQQKPGTQWMSHTSSEAGRSSGNWPNGRRSETTISTSFDSGRRGVNPDVALCG